MATKNDNTGRIILVIAAILVLSALGYFATRYFSIRKQSEDQVIEIEDLKKEVVELENDIVNLNTTIEDQNLALAEKDRLLSERDQQLEALTIKLNRYRNSSTSNQKEAKELQNRVELLRSQMRTYEERITELEAVVAQQADTIANQRAENLAKQERIEDLDRANQEKEDRLRKAGILQAADFVIYNVRREGEKEIRDTEFRRGRIKELKICFNLLQNSEAQPGPRDIYLVMENPDGTTSTNFEEGLSGEFSFNNRNLTYSSKTRVDYNLITQEVCIPYAASDASNYQKGEQYLSVYVDGRLIGQSSFIIK